MTNSRSRDLFAKAQDLMPGGVSSPVRAYRAVGGDPSVIAYASGAHIVDVDGNDYIDYVGAYGPPILCHAHPDIAAVIVEPIAGNMGVIPPAPDFLESLREITTQHGALLIFDEVITGFRLCYGGAQTLLGVEPDITCLGKIIGGGLPVGAYGGRCEVVEVVAALGSGYQGGRLFGNSVCMVVGVGTLKGGEGWTGLG